MSGGTRGALRMQQNLNNPQPVDQPLREEDIQMNPPEQNPNLQQPIVPPQINNDVPQGIHQNNRAQDNPDPDGQQNPAQALANVPAEINNTANQPCVNTERHKDISGNEVADWLFKLATFDTDNLQPLADSSLTHPLSLSVLRIWCRAKFKFMADSTKHTKWHKAFF
ncbi:hypothetical protein PPACK8108_LOCUS11663 [Phakopsora pachyrhizi]|uniref:Uncharacterized protein n=1 Tax=Phakopsora pachyrhizi TaxID=170000 RepID=A0AAV0B2H8_PHAPC|nr:hypothetical protein PPACK8108_LOCUS11663 [Phakopsora pachyrhizi]